MKFSCASACSFSLYNFASCAFFSRSFWFRPCTCSSLRASASNTPSGFTESAAAVRRSSAFSFVKCPSASTPQANVMRQPDLYRACSKTLIRPTGAVLMKCVPQQVHISVRSPSSTSTMRTSPCSFSFFLRSGRFGSSEASTLKIRTGAFFQTSSFAYFSPASIFSSDKSWSRSMVTTSPAM